MNGFSITVTIFGGLGLFLFGMKIMSEALQKATGERLRDILGKVTNNRFLGVLTGFFITSIIQSSSATTVMIVSFVNASLINLQQSIGIILGANIGTTVTGWIVALLGFKIKIATFALPAIGVGFFLRFFRNEKYGQWGEVLLGFGLLFLGLDTINETVKDLRGSQVVLNFMSMFHASSIPSTLVVVLIGGVVTMVVQSSSATMAMTMTLAVNGLIDFPTSCALILGENIGTTVTANIASVGASVAAKRSARVHLLFNVLGVVWMIGVFHWLFIPFIDWLVPGDPYSSSISVRSAAIADHMAAFHTLFNVVNTILFLPLTGLLAKAASRLVLAKRKKGEDEEFHLKYITSILVATPSININQARLETKRMVGIIIDMYDMVIDVFKNPQKKLGEVVEEIQKKENMTDILEKEISEYLVSVSQNNISQEQSYEISNLLHMVNDIERIGDHCENLLKLLRRKYDSKLEFSENAYQEIDEISGKVHDFLQLINNSIMTSHVNILSTADVIENRIDELRKELRQKHITRLSEGSCDVPSGLVFIDMLNSFEKIGDHAFNVAEAISSKKLV